MPSFQFEIKSNGQGLYEFTDRVHRAIVEGGVLNGICVVFVRHTSASLIIQENADPSAREDLEKWLARHVPEEAGLYRHAAEGPDDMPAHIKAALTQTSLTIPVMNGSLTLGTWQGIFLWEHRRKSQTRSIVVTVIEG